MMLELISQPLDWPLIDNKDQQEICHDWFGQPLAQSARFRLIEDSNLLWLIATRDCNASPHPSATCGEFKAGLWHYDVAELFITTPDFKQYLEFNLSPSGAWWAALFCGPRRRSKLNGLPKVICRADPMESGGWIAALGIPLAWLRQNIDWGPNSPLNVTFILDSPDQRFLSACQMGSGEPDFHRPRHFKPPNRRSPRA